MCYSLSQETDGAKEDVDAVSDITPHDMKDEEEAKDCVQQIFLKAITELPKYKVDFFKSSGCELQNPGH
mgnify:CR=1 FL=1